MFTMILISSVAVLVALLGSALIWGLDAVRADEIERAVPTSPSDAAPSRALPTASPSALPPAAA